MSQAFDPYQVWLGIPLSEQPPNHYRLLGVPTWERDPMRIAQAAERRMQIVRAMARADRAELAEQIIGKIAAARATLLNPALRQHYDSLLATAPYPQAASVQPARQAESLLQSLPVGGGAALRGDRKGPRKKSGLTLLFPVAAGAAAVVGLAVVLVAVLRPGGDRLAGFSTPNESRVAHDAAQDRDDFDEADDELPPRIRRTAGRSSRRVTHHFIQGPQTMADLMAAADDVPADGGSITSKLRTAQQAMAGGNLDAARHHLESVQNSAQSPTERAELDRATRLLALLEEFRSAVRHSAAALKLDETIQLEGGPVVVMGNSGEELVLRVAGENHPYALSELPRPVLLALARRGLADADPHAELVIGTFLAIDSRGDRTLGRQMLEQAGDEGRALLADLDQMPQ